MKPEKLTLWSKRIPLVGIKVDKKRRNPTIETRFVSGEMEDYCSKLNLHIKLPL